MAADASAVSSLLRELPSRGAFVSAAPSTAPRRPLPTYIAAHDTSPPAHQVIATDPTNLLIRSLNIQRKQREDAARAARAAGAAGAAAPAKRGAGSPDGDAPPAKRATAAGGSGGASGAGASGSGAPAAAPATEAELKAMTKAQLVDRARAARLTHSGATKAVLVARLLAHQRGTGGGGGVMGGERGRRG